MTSLDTQPISLSRYVLLSLFPPPQTSPYLRKFLAARLAAGLPMLIARAFVRGLAQHKLGGPVHTRTLLFNILYTCDPAGGDDGDAPMNAQTCVDLAAHFTRLLADAPGLGLGQASRGAAESLDKLLKQIKYMALLGGGPSDTFLRAVRDQGLLEHARVGGVRGVRRRGRRRGRRRVARASSIAARRARNRRGRRTRPGATNRRSRLGGTRGEDGFF
jgi:hypothetical protein